MRPRRRTTWQSGCRNFNAPMDETTFILYQLQQIEGWERPESDTTWSKIDAAERRSITIPKFASISKKKENQHEIRLPLNVIEVNGLAISTLQAM